MSDDETTVYDQIEIEDFAFDQHTQLFTYPCPCGDRFEIFLDDLRDGQDVAVCPSCSLTVLVVFEPEDLEPFLKGRTGTEPVGQQVAVAV